MTPGPRLRLPGRALWSLVAGCVAVLVARSAAPLPDSVALHLTNAGFTGLGLLLVARTRLQRGVTRRWLRGYGALWAALNVAVEAFDVGDLRAGVFSFQDVNTGDPLDAVFGVAAVGVLLLLVVRLARPVPPR